MSDLGYRAVDTLTTTKTVVQTYALRGWLTALLAQTVQAETTLKYRIADLDTEAKRLQDHLEQTTAAIETLRRSIRTTDEAIGRRMSDLKASVALDRRGELAEVEIVVDDERAKNAQQAPRPERPANRQHRRHRPNE